MNNENKITINGLVDGISILEDNNEQTIVLTNTAYNDNEPYSFGTELHC